MRMCRSQEMKQLNPAEEEGLRWVPLTLHSGALKFSLLARGWLGEPEPRTRAGLHKEWGCCWPSLGWSCPEGNGTFFQKGGP